MPSKSPDAAASRAVQLSGPVAALMDELLHAMGQPLTVLQGAALLPVLPAGEARESLLTELTEQVARATEIYRALRTLFDAEAVADQQELAQLPLSEAVRGLEGEWRRVAERRGVRLVVEPGEAGVRMGRLRAEQVLRLIFDEALAHTPNGRVLEVAELRAAAETVPQGEAAGDRYGLVWRAEGEVSRPDLAGPDSGRSESRWGLRVAGALVEQEGGRMVYRLQPFAAWIEFPRERA